MAHAEQQVKIADNKITLHQRDDVREEALQMPGEMNQRQHQSQSQNLPIRRKTFAEIATSFLKDVETKWKEGRNSQGRYEL